MARYKSRAKRRTTEASLVFETITAQDALSRTIEPSSPALWRGAKSLDDMQPLVRGVEALSLVARGVCRLSDLSGALGLTVSSTSRLADILVQHRLLIDERNGSFSLGPELIHLGCRSARQTDLVTVAHDHMFALCVETGGAADLGIFDGESALYLHRVQPGNRVGAGARVGELHLLSFTGVGKALLLDEKEAILKAVFSREVRRCSPRDLDRETWLHEMRDFVARGYVFASEEGGRVQSTAAPIRDASNRIIGAISLSNGEVFSNVHRLRDIACRVLETAQNVSAELGWTIVPSKIVE